MKIEIIKLPSNKKALGGVLQSHGSDWSSGLIHINAGGTHEENKYDGVQLGQDQNLVPNLVEENETVFNDYVYSARINLDAQAKEKFHFPKKKDITYAEATKKLEKEIAERPNDPISKASFKAQMETLANEQERQKQEMEAERAKAAFEALSPEEQTAIMQRAAQEEAMAQEAVAQQEAVAAQNAAQVNPEEAAMMQQQMMQADGSEAALGQEPQIMAEGGNLFPWGGYENLFSIKPPYQASNTIGFIPYDRNLTEEEVLKLEQEKNFRDWTDYVNQNWDSDEIQNYLKLLDTAAGGNHLFDKEGKLLDTAKDYFNNARTKNHKWGYYHLTPKLIEEAVKKEADKEAVTTAEPKNRIFHALEGDDDYIQGELDPEVVGAETRRVKLDNGDTVIYHGRKARKNTPIDENDTKRVAPNLRNEKLRYAGLFGPAVGLGMQLAGVGKPDIASLDAATSGAGNVALADYQPLGDYLTYRPMDIWYEQNRLNANARATDRAILNTGANQGSKASALLASGYNDQLASGDLYRKALEYNDALRERVAAFNRGTNQFNADAYNQTSRFNASALNDANRASAQMKLNAAAQKLDANAGWYNGIYGNVAGLFKGLGELGKENAQHNMIVKMGANGIFGTATPDTPVFDDYLKWLDSKANEGSTKKCKGGKINRGKLKL